MPMRHLIPQSWDKNAPVSRDPFLSLRNEMERLFDNFAWPGFGGSDVSPRIDISESDTELDIDAELPGLEEKDIDVTLAGDVLTIRGEKKSEREEKNKNYRMSERSYGSFSRSIALPFDADPGRVSARFDKGVLRIAIAKPETVTAKTAKIPIRKG